MAEKPMTPHERAEELVRALGYGGRVGADLWASAITTALQAQSNADEARHREKQAEANIQCEIRYAETSRAEQAESERDAVQAREAELRRALDGLTAEVEAVALGEFGGDWVDQFGPLFEATESARAALALSPSDALAAQQKREAEQAALVEQLRLALEPFAAMIGDDGAAIEGHVTNVLAARALFRYLNSMGHVHAPNGGAVVNASAIWDLAESARSALALSPGEALKTKGEAE